MPLLYKIQSSFRFNSSTSLLNGTITVFLTLVKRAINTSNRVNVNSNLNPYTGKFDETSTKDEICSYLFLITVH